MEAWDVGNLLSFQLGGCLRHVWGEEDEAILMQQEWMEGRSLVRHRFLERNHNHLEEEENEVYRKAKGRMRWMTPSKVDVKKDKFHGKVSVTFCQDMFIYKESMVKTTKRCAKCEHFSYTWHATACFTK